MQIVKAIMAAVAPYITDENMFNAALWFLRQVIERTPPGTIQRDNVKRYALEFLAKVTKLIEQL